MTHLTRDTFKRPTDITNRNDPSALYARSYLLIRTVVGSIGVGLPTALFLLDRFYLKGDAKVRGSISAYYHSSARDLLVGGLCVIGFLLITYMAGQVESWDFWLSLVAGITVLGVAFFPTGRPNLQKGDPLCGPDTTPVPPSCAPMQNAIGETLSSNIHAVCAIVFIVSLAMICFAFASRAKKYEQSQGRTQVYVACGIAIFIVLLWAALSKTDIFGFTPIYVAEIVSVYAFAVSWLVNGRAIWTLLRKNATRSMAVAGPGFETRQTRVE
jgi:hypothetical protein